MFKSKNEGRNNLCGEKVRALRLAYPAKLSQRALAEIFGVGVDKLV